MAIVKKSDQMLYTGKGPLDAKSTVKTYSELLSTATWTTSINNTDTFVAYNGMLVAVWLDKTDTAKNGLYFLYDALADTAKKKPDVTLESNWHKLVDITEIEKLVSRLSTVENELVELDARLSALEEDSDILTFGYRTGFPAVGELDKLYIAADEGKSYIWFNGDYMSIGGDSEQPEIIFGGNAD